MCHKVDSHKGYNEIEKENKLTLILSHSHKLSW
jgi:hypothetical protein